MTSPRQPFPTYLPEVGCGLVLAALMTMCLLPYLVVGAMETALARLHLWPPVAFVCLVGIFAGSLVNIPVRYIDRQVEQIVLARGWSGWINRSPLLRRSHTETIIAVNVGGCVIPALLALYETVVVLLQGRYAAWALAVSVLTNILVCYYVARPVAGVGIAMPGFVSPTVAVGLSWLLLSQPEMSALRAPAAFVSGVCGPLFGADLLRLREFTKVSVGVLSIGGAGTFDGIVLSGMLAAILA